MTDEGREVHARVEHRLFGSVPEMVEAERR